jgi:segregation and condensation protein B
LFAGVAIASAISATDTENRIMEISQIIPHVESLIFAADRPLPLLEILDLLNNALAFLEDRANLEQVETALEAIKEKYNTEFYAFEVRESGGGYQFLTKKEYYQTVAQLNGEKFLKRLSTAALETLAIVAYKQPISKGEIEHIRGVSTDYSIQKLLEKELIVISGRSEQLPGKPLLYSTSKAFMDYFGLNSPKDLPKLKEVFDEESIQPTLIGLDGNAAAVEGAEEDNLNMVVSETGELLATELPVTDEPDITADTTPAEDIPVVEEDVPLADETTPAPEEELPIVEEEEAPEEEEETPGTAEEEDDTVADEDMAAVTVENEITDNISASDNEDVPAAIAAEEGDEAEGENDGEGEEEDGDDDENSSEEEDDNEAGEDNDDAEDEEGDDEDLEEDDDDDIEDDDIEEDDDLDDEDEDEDEEEDDDKAPEHR